MADPKGMTTREAYLKYRSSPRKLKEQRNRNKNRRRYTKLGLVKKGDGKAIDHKDGNALNNKRTNLQIMSHEANRRKQ